MLIIYIYLKWHNWQVEINQSNQQLAETQQLAVQLAALLVEASCS